MPAATPQSDVEKALMQVEPVLVDRRPRAPGPVIDQGARQFTKETKTRSVMKVGVKEIAL